LKKIYSVNEPEFRSYMILLLQDQKELVYALLALSPEIRQSPEVLFAIQVNVLLWYSDKVKIDTALRNGDYSGFFKLLEKADYLTACLMHLRFRTVRMKALKTINGVYKGAIPLSHLVRVCIFFSALTTAGS
jgi:hypothetical protein